MPKPEQNERQYWLILAFAMFPWVNFILMLAAIFVRMHHMVAAISIDNACCISWLMTALSLNIFIRTRNKKYLWILLILAPITIFFVVLFIWLLISPVEWANQVEQRLQRTSH